MAVKKTSKKAKTKKSTQKPAKRTVKKATRRPAVKAKKNTAKKKAAVKKVAKKKAVKKPAKKKAKKVTTKKVQKKNIAKKAKKITNKAAEKQPAKPVNKPLAKKATNKTTKSKPPRATVKAKVAAKPSTHGKKSSVSALSSTQQDQTEKARTMPEEIHPPTIQVDASPDEFANPEDLRTTAGAVEFTPYNTEPKEEYMNDQQHHHFHNILLKWKGQLMSEVDSTVGHMQQEALSLPDPLDRAAQEEGFNLELRTRDRERKLIKKIEQSLDDIEKGVYGYCEDCGVKIGIRRLEARPTAVKCIDCKTFSEIRERQEGLS